MYTLVQKQNLETAWRRSRQVCMSLVNSPAKDRNAFGRTQPGPDCSCLWTVCVLRWLQSCPTLCNPMDCSPPAPQGPWDSPGKNTAVGCHALLQGIFPTQGLNVSFLDPALAGRFFATSATWEAPSVGNIRSNNLECVDIVLVCFDALSYREP